MTDRPTLIVDLEALAANFATLRAMAPGARTLPVVKADGYGLGAIPVSRQLIMEGAEALFVARAHEGETLRQALGGLRPIFVLEGVTAQSAPRLADAGLTPVLNSAEQVDVWAQAEPKAALTLHVDTGMNRLGLSLEAAESIAADQAHGPRVARVISHLACAASPDDPMNARQRETMLALRPLFPNAWFSLASSGGVMLGPEYHLDETRPGIALYGGGPQHRTDTRLKPVATVLAPILQVRSIKPGDSIGYGADFTADRPLRAAVLGIGYADGLLRASSPGGYAVLAGSQCRYLGRLSMDLLVIDVTEVADARPGVLIEVIGPNVPIDDLAGLAGTTAYELLTRFGNRFIRLYRGAAT